MTREQTLYLLIPAAYLVGSIPFGLLVGLSRGIDPRKAGSGNTGATNIGRLLGAIFFALVFTLDFFKGLTPVLAAGVILNFVANDWLSSLLWILIGLAALSGNLFSVFLKFKGGKGVATSTGIVIGIFPYYTFPGLLAVATWLIVFKLTRFVSVASMIGAGLMPLSYVLIGLWRGWPIFDRQLPLLIFIILIPALIIIRHRSNIARLRAGSENRFAPGKKHRAI